MPSYGCPRRNLSYEHLISQARNISISSHNTCTRRQSSNRDRLGGQTQTKQDGKKNCQANKAQEGRGTLLLLVQRDRHERIGFNLINLSLVFRNSGLRTTRNGFPLNFRPDRHLKVVDWGSNQFYGKEFLVCSSTKRRSKENPNPVPEISYSPGPPDERFLFSTFPQS